MYRSAMSSAKSGSIEKTASTIHNIGFRYLLPLRANRQKSEAIYLETGENYIDLMKFKIIAGRILTVWAGAIMENPAD